MNGKNLLSNLKLSHMIMIIVLVPLAALIFFASSQVITQVQRSSAMAKLENLTVLAVKLSALVHERQKERGMTAGFLAAPDGEFAAKLDGQRQLTDKARSDVDTFLTAFDAELYGSRFQSDLSTLVSMLDQKTEIRGNVDNRSIAAAEAIGYYTKANNRMLGLIEEMGNMSPDAVVLSRIVGYTNFLQSKERAGIERAVGAAQFGAGRFAPEPLDKFKRLITIQETYNAVFLTQATPEQKALFDEVMGSPAAREVERMRKIAVTGGPAGELDGITGVQWFDTVTQKINGLKQIEDSLGASLLRTLAELRAAADSGMWMAIASALGALFLVAVLSTIIIRSINHSFRTLTNSMTELANGNTEIELPPAGTNEIGEMSKCVQVFKENAVEKAALEARQHEAAERAEAEKRALMNKLADDLDASVTGIVETLVAASTELSATADSMSGIAETTSGRATTAAGASEQASANVQTVASATEEMAAAIAEINSQIVDASKSSENAAQTVGTVSRQIENLAVMTDRIGEVIGLISDIAEQTNLLALNATIESARAGEAG
ncbi:MAG: nitrate- and nitrite sensing domain-containing protein, partial [Hyphomicrobiales bacterium]|nr:nitrate- and nitrite sensing domain-containing protein [Hyphomicrobiales bacterium]